MTDHNKKDVAAADVALPHRAAGERYDKAWQNNQPFGQHSRSGAPPKSGAYPADCKSDGGYGQPRAGKLRVSGDPRAHQIGKR